MIDMPVNVSHEMRRTVRALRPIEGELVTTIAISSRYFHLPATPGANPLTHGARHDVVPTAL